MNMWISVEEASDVLKQGDGVSQVRNCWGKDTPVKQMWLYKIKAWHQNNISSDGTNL